MTRALILSRRGHQNSDIALHRPHDGIIKMALYTARRHHQNGPVVPNGPGRSYYYGTTRIKRLKAATGT
jgi:hypothetical protein